MKIKNGEIGKDDKSEDVKQIHESTISEEVEDDGEKRFLFLKEIIIDNEKY